MPDPNALGRSFGPLFRVPHLTEITEIEESAIPDSDDCSTGLNESDGKQTDEKGNAIRIRRKRAAKRERNKHARNHARYIANSLDLAHHDNAEIHEPYVQDAQPHSCAAMPALPEHLAKDKGKGKGKGKVDGIIGNTSR